VVSSFINPDHYASIIFISFLTIYYTRKVKEMRDKIEYEVLEYHNRGWYCYNYLDSYGNYHSEVKLPRESIVAEILFYGGYGYDSWGSTHYLLDTNEVIHSSFYGAESYCKVYKDESIVIKSVVKNLLIRKNHPKINVYNLELFKQKFPLIYKLAKYYYCKRHLSYLSVVVYDKRYRSICSD